MMPGDRRLRYGSSRCSCGSHGSRGGAYSLTRKSCLRAYLCPQLGRAQKLGTRPVVGEMFATTPGSSFQSKLFPRQKTSNNFRQTNGKHLAIKEVISQSQHSFAWWARGFSEPSHGHLDGEW